jgi:phage baseplate assembly protein W
MAIWTGYNPPFLRGSNVMPVQQDARLIKNDLIQLLLTNLGERVMRPDIGSPIPSLQFENIVDGDIAILKADIASSIAKFEPRITIDEIQIKLKQDDSMIIINITGAVNLSPSNKFNIAIGVDGSGGIAFVRAA